MADNLQDSSLKNRFVAAMNNAKEILDAITGFASDRIGSLVGIGIVALVVWISWKYLSAHLQDGAIESWEIILFVVIASSIFGIVVWFLVVFSGREVSNAQLSRVIVFCYVFTWLSILSSILPFIVFPLSNQLPRLMMQSPIGIVKGCVESLDNGKNALPLELQCGKNTDQWIVNVGGRVEPQSDANREQEDIKSWVPARIQGGLAVPLYFVVLALVGSAVSMTRRVPEYQERTGPDTSQPITNGKAREYLVLQILQVVSAPLIAITAYYLVDPTSRATTVALGFVSGFASETVLLYIRALTTKLQPDKPRVTGTPGVELSATSLNFGRQAVGTRSSAQTVTIVNRTGNPINVSKIETTGDFAQNITSPLTIAAGATCAIDVTFVPSGKGACTGILSIVDDAPGSPRSVSLSGKGA
ncbi:MAG: choice-of-anchor D domain-containing protein [Betaproteobacteria bacterium]|nr:choice-of-anchor D domain-containing protein [Betaproteobacteria bacterium]